MRPSIDVYMMGMALMASTRATCSRRSVGCVLINKHNHIIATGYNGVPASMPHCSSQMCPGRSAESGQQLDGCMAIHAEQNALLQVRDAHDITTIYCTTQPCLTCTKLLLNTSCKRIVYLKSYPHSIAEDLWTSTGRTIEQFSDEDSATLSTLFRALSSALN